MSETPLRSTTFVLTGADALAYEQAAHRLSPIGTFALLLWLAVWGAAATLIPADWIGRPLSWSFPLVVGIAASIGYVLALVLISLRQWQAARRRIHRPLQLTVTEYPDRLVLSGTDLPASIGFAEIRRTILTPTHLFLALDNGVVILPRRAFPEDGVLDALVSRIGGAAPQAMAAPPVAAVLVEPDPLAPDVPPPVDPPPSSA
ncbi:MAG: hypothetical protein ABI697_12400 [Devosia sp.]